MWPHTATGAAHDAGCDFKRATLEVLVEFTEHLRLRGFMASLADTIEAYRLALTLADIRGKAEPGLDELREATIATLCRGDATHVDGFLWPSVIGRHIGRVADRIARTTWVGESEEALPLIIDDAFVDVEPSELFKLLDLIVRLSSRTQIVLLTSDATIAKWARREAAHGIISLLETDGAAIR